MTWTPRRAPKRFIEGAPKELIAVYDNGGKTLDRYTAVYSDSFLYRGQWWTFYRGMSEDPFSPGGYGIMGEISRYDLSAYRNRVYRQYVSYDSLPEQVKKSIELDCQAIRENEE